VFSVACGTPRCARQTVLSLFPENTSEKKLKNIDFAFGELIHFKIIIFNKKKGCQNMTASFY